MDKEGTLHNIEGSLRHQDAKSVFSWLKRIHKTASGRDYDDLLLEVEALAQQCAYEETKRYVLDGLTEELARIKMARFEEEAEKERARIAAEEVKRQESEKRRVEKQETEIRDAIAYLDSVSTSFTDVRRDDLPAFARSRRIEILLIKKEAEAKAARQRMQEEEYKRLEALHKFFLSTKGLDSEIRILISSQRPTRRRITHCYACKSHLDEALHLNCSECGWIVCPDCGACGCGYTK